MLITWVAYSYSVMKQFPFGPFGVPASNVVGLGEIPTTVTWFFKEEVEKPAKLDSKTPLMQP